MRGQDVRQALAAIAVSIVAADLMLAQWGGTTYQLTIPDALQGFVAVPFARRYGLARLALIGLAIAIGAFPWLLLRFTRLGLLIRAGAEAITADETLQHRYRGVGTHAH